MRCLRCKEPEPFQFGPRCFNCGVHKHRVVRKAKRMRPIGGKRGRNSGKTSNAKGGKQQ